MPLLIYLSKDSRVKREYSNPRRFSFFLGPDAKVHTPYDFLIKKGRVKDFDDLQNRFSIEVVNKEFYKEIANWYFWALKKVKFPDDAETEKNGREISVIRMITRLIFIWFMKVRKLVPEELFNEKTIKGILTDVKSKDDNYYKAILQNLFFATLNTKKEDRRFTSKKKGYKGFSHDFGNHNVYRYEELFRDSEEVIEKYFMPIPFLNGGLFECLDYKTKTRNERKYIDGFTSTKSQQPIIPNYLFFNVDKEINLNEDYGTTNKRYNVRGLINTLSLYNFTIDEGDPNDADVALDPELLGKVFENLLASYNPETAKTARKSTGSYYTPRPIVDYMVDESLKQYFKTHIQLDDIDSKLNILFSGEDQSNPFDSVQTKKLVNLIDSLRVVDPAVGSGAFPMRILNRLVFLLHKLDPDNSLWKQSQIEGIKKSVRDITLQRKFIEETERKFKEKNPNYGRKLYLIEKCIYGVDIQQIAVEIAKLRFFISLLVDEKVENGAIEPLPNLDFKLMQGNSLISSFAGIDFTTKSQNDDNLFDFDEKYKKLIDEFEELKSQYQNEPDVHKKRKLRDDIDAKLLEIFEEKLKQHYPQLKDLESKYSGRKEIIEAEKKKLFKKIGIDLDQAEQDLIAYTEGRKQKDFFLWDVYFAEVFAEKNGFDIVIGNPPWIQSKVISQDVKIIYQNYYNTAFGQYDLFNLFIEKGLSVLIKDTGSLIFITPDRFITNIDYTLVRKYLLNNSFILEITSLGDDVFENVSMPSAILHTRNQTRLNEQIKCRGYFSSDFNYKQQNDFLMNDNHIFKIFGNSKIDVILENISRISEKLEKHLINARGVEIGKNSKAVKFVFKKGFKKFLRGEDIDRYSINSNVFIDTSYSNIDYKNDSLYRGTKILIRKTGSGIIAVVDDEYRYVIQTIYVFKKYNNSPLDERYILGFLNSKLIAFWYNYTFGEKDRRIFPHLTQGKVLVLPILNISSTKQKAIINNVNKILSVKMKNTQMNTKNLEDQIDIMVYKLYNLSYEEVEIIDPQIGSIMSKEDFDKFEIQ